MDCGISCDAEISLDLVRTSEGPFLRKPVRNRYTHGWMSHDEFQVGMLIGISDKNSSKLNYYLVTDMTWEYGVLKCQTNNGSENLEISFVEDADAKGLIPIFFVPGVDHQKIIIIKDGEIYATQADFLREFR